MALTATVYNINVELADIDRSVYETLDFRVAQQPSETIEYMATRILAYCLEFCEGIELTQGVASGDEPALLVRDLTGRVTAWIEVGMPDAERLHRGSKLAGRVAVYTHREPRQLLAQLSGRKIHRGEEIPIYAFDRKFMDELCPLIEKRTRLSLSITERQLYADLSGHTFNTTIAEHRIS